MKICLIYTHIALLYFVQKEAEKPAKIKILITIFILIYRYPRYHIVWI